MAVKHTDGHGNMTLRTYSGGGYTSTPYQPRAQQAAPYTPDDPFAQYANASISPPDAVTVQPVAPVGISPDGALLSNYNKFLLAPGRDINPNTIGTATIDRDTGRMIVPSVALEYAAANRNNQQNALERDLLKDAQKSRRKGDTDKALEYEGQVRDMNNARGKSYEDRLNYFLAMAQAASPPPIPSANGFS